MLSVVALRGTKSVAKTLSQVCLFNPKPYIVTDWKQCHGAHCLHSPTEMRVHDLKQCIHFMYSAHVNRHSVAKTLSQVCLFNPQP